MIRNEPLPTQRDRRGPTVCARTTHRPVSGATQGDRNHGKRPGSGTAQARLARRVRRRCTALDVQEPTGRAGGRRHRAECEPAAVTMPRPVLRTLATEAREATARAIAEGGAGESRTIQHAHAPTITRGQDVRGASTTKAAV